MYRGQISRRRNLKLGAFHRVDELQARVYDYGNDGQVVRAHTVMGTINQGVPPSCKLYFVTGATRPVLQVVVIIMWILKQQSFLQYHVRPCVDIHAGQSLRR